MHNGGVSTLSQLKESLINTTDEILALVEGYYHFLRLTLQKGKLLRVPGFVSSWVVSGQWSKWLLFMPKNLFFTIARSRKSEIKCLFKIMYKLSQSFNAFCDKMIVNNLHL